MRGALSPPPHLPEGARISAGAVRAMADSRESMLHRSRNWYMKALAAIRFLPFSFVVADRAVHAPSLFGVHIEQHAFNVYCPPLLPARCMWRSRGALSAESAAPCRESAPRSPRPLAQQCGASQARRAN